MRPKQVETRGHRVARAMRVFELQCESLIDRKRVDREGPISSYTVLHIFNSFFLNRAVLISDTFLVIA